MSGLEALAALSLNSSNKSTPTRTGIKSELNASNGGGGNMTDSANSEQELLAALQLNPYDCDLRIKLIRHYLNCGRIEYAYRYAIKLDSKGIFPNKQWFQCLVDVIERYMQANRQQAETMNALVYFMVALDELLEYTIKDRSLDEKTKIIPQAITLLQKYDAALHKLSKCEGSDRRPWTTQSLRGNLYFWMASLLMKRAQNDLGSGKEASRYSAYLHSLSYSINLASYEDRAWINGLSPELKTLYQKICDNCVIRAVSSGLILISVSKGDNVWLQRLYNDVAIQKTQNRLLSIFYDSLGSKKSSELDSYLAFDKKFLQPEITSLPGMHQIASLAEIAVEMKKDSLHHLVWLGYHLDKEYMRVRLGNSLKMSSSNLKSGLPETLCQMDIDAFLTASIYCVNRVVQERSSLAADKISYNFIEAPPSAALELISSEQKNWWTAIYEALATKNTKRFGEKRRLIQWGLEYIRGIGYNSIDTPILIHLARTFANQTNYNAIDGIPEDLSVEGNEFLNWAVHYWRVALEALDKPTSHRMSPRKVLFKLSASSPNREETTQTIQEANLFLGLAMMRLGNMDEASEYLSKVESAAGHFHMGRALLALYEKQAKENGPPHELNFIITRARDAFYHALDLVNTDKHNPLVNKLPQFIEQSELLVSEPLSNLKNGSDSSFMLNNSSLLHTPSARRSTTNSLNQSVSQQSFSNVSHVRPSPEKIDAQLKQLAFAHESSVQKLQDTFMSCYSDMLKAINAVKESVVRIESKADQNTAAIGELSEACKTIRESIQDFIQGNYEQDYEGDEDHEGAEDEDNGEGDWEDLGDEHEPQTTSDMFASQVAQDIAQINLSSSADSKSNLYSRLGSKATPPTQQPTGQSPLVTTSPGNLFTGFNLTPTGTSFASFQPNLSQFPSTPKAATPLHSWVCSCELKNQGSVASCFGCGAPNPNRSPPKATEITPSVPIGFGLGTGGNITATTPFGVQNQQAPASSFLNSPSLFGSTVGTNLTLNFSLGAPTAPAPAPAESLGKTSPFKFAPPSFAVTAAPSTTSSFSFSSSIAQSAPSISPMTAPVSFSTVTSSVPTPSQKTPQKDSPTVCIESPESSNADQIHFTPVIPLPPEIEVKTGEEDEEILFAERAKLYRFVEQEWKERGVGEMKILKGKNTGKIRLLMRRDQILKLCLNHWLTNELDLKPKTNRGWTWGAVDFSDEESRPELFTIKFKTEEQALEFKKAIDNAKHSLRHQPRDVAAVSDVATIASSKSNISRSTQDDSSKPLSELFKPPPGSWTCSACYVRNQRDSGKCISCESPNPNAPPSLSSQSSESKPAASPQFKFGFGTAALGSTPAAPATTASPFAGFAPKPDTTSPFKFGFQFGSPTTQPTAIESSQSFTPQADAVRIESNADISSSSQQFEEVESPEPSIHFTPVIPLPPKVEVKTGEEDEDILFVERAKLFRYVNKEWKERGVGDLKILQDKTTKKIRLLMRRDQIFKICLNHWLTRDLEFNPKGKKEFTWNAMDFSEEEPKAEVFAIRFKNPEIAQSFSDVVTKCKALFSSDGASDAPDSLLSKEPSGKVEQRAPHAGPTVMDDEIEIVYEKKVDEEKRQAAMKLRLPPNFYDYENLPPCPGCYGCNDHIPTLTFEKEGKDKFAAGDAGPISASAAPSDNESIFEKLLREEGVRGGGWTAPKEKPSWLTDAPKPIFGAQKNQDESGEGEHDPQFAPVIPLPDLVEVKTGEEEEEALFAERAKLYRFEHTTKEWKERGVGTFKILKNPQSGKIRFVMRRDQIHKVCLNHWLTESLDLKPKNEKSWTWNAVDYTEGEARAELFAIRFKNEDLALEFKKRVNSAKELLGVKSGDLASSTSTFNTQKPLSELFKPAADSWTCNSCYLNNKGSDIKCAACEAAKP